MVHDDRPQGLVSDVDLGLVEPVALELAPEQVVTSDRHLLVLGVAVEGKDLHAVQERARHRVGDVGRGQEHHVTQVEVDLQIVVPERVVLGRVENLQQCGRGIASPVSADLVDLVEQEHGVHRPASVIARTIRPGIAPT